MGCLKAMAVRAGCAVMLAAALAAGFIYRKPLWDYYRQWRGAAPEVFVAPAEGDLAKANATLARLERPGGPAYVDLGAAEVAAVVDDALAQAGKRVFDSVRVALADNEIRVTGSLDLGGVPRSLLGPLAGMERRHEPATVGGPLGVDSAGHLVLTVTTLKLHDFPFPKSVIPRILEAASIPGARGARVPLPGTTRLGDVRVSPDAVRAYRASPN